MRLTSIIIAAFFISLCVCSISLASPEESFYKGNVLGSAGWDFGYDSEEEEEVKRNSERNKEEGEQKKVKRNDDFFTKDVRVYDRGISRTAKEEQKLKGRGLRKSPY